MSDLLNQIDFHQQVLHTTGLGGSVLLMSHKKNDSERYVVKLEKLDQSYNEYFGQCLFSALGYVGIESCLMLFGNKCAGAIRYQSNLRRIYANDISKLSSDQRKSFVALYVLNGLLGNADDGEIYIDINGDMLCLDLGEAFLGEYGVKIHRNGFGRLFTANNQNNSVEQETSFRSSFNSRISLCLNYIDNTNEEMADEIIDAGIDALYALAELDIKSLCSCFNSISEHVSKELAEGYRAWLLQRISMAQNSLNALE